MTYILRLLVAVIAVAAAACTSSSTALSGGAAGPDPANATYQIDKDRITLSAGRAEREAAPGSATKIVTTLADQRATADVDGDKTTDTVVIVVNQPGGSGTFYYLAVLLNAKSGVFVPQTVLLGDRIKPTGLRVDGLTIVVEYLDRQPSQPFTASPLVPTTKKFVVQGGAIVPQ